ncbi:MAG: hydantoinase B/oxoprolinase family protein [Rhodospirillaceae bacterium]|jgi:N-methylhydantoinase B|nr:hydantoinase B/oxoprolinase family protein [Rhodospirillaceae bacterium]MBT6537201.1 hydantoinase B/oxoprolinase family protein [Rhodospirillaceae bacterium]
MQLDPVTIQILWNRLITIVDEAATGLMRTAYTPSVKEYHDFCCALFDANAQMLSHSTVTTAGFLGIVPEVMRNFLKKHPPETLKPGDAIITNDPWIASGHLIDISIASPIFHNDRIVGYTLCIVHHLDMGGRMSTLESKDMYEEGLKIPILKLFDAGQRNETVFEFIRANIRVPDKVLGDLRAQLVANNVCARGLNAMLDEYSLDGLEELGAEVIERTESSLRRKIAALPDGAYRNDVVLPKIPGCDDEIEIKTLVTVAGDEVTIDYSGSSGEVGAAINCSYNMTRSYTSYPIKLALDPYVPNNDGGLRPIKVIAPEGTIVNSRPPAATWGRTMISHLFPEIVFAAMENIMPETILASNGGSPANEVYLHGRHADERSFMAIAQHSGGFGASARFDGYSCLCFPNNTRNIPVEVTENEARMYYVRKELRADSGGPGHNRGGLGQEIEFSILDGGTELARDVESSVRLSGRTEDGPFPVFGRRGGKNGRGSGMWANDEPVDHGIYRRLAPGDRVRFILSGGGGYGDPLERNPDRVLADVEQGYVSIEQAGTEYGVVIDPSEMTVDVEATASLRARMS